MTIDQSNDVTISVADASLWPPNLSPGQRQLANAILWDLRLGGPITDSSNATGELRGRLEGRGLEVPGSPTFGQLLKALAEANLIARVSTGTRLREIRLAKRKTLPPCPFVVPTEPTEAAVESPEIAEVAEMEAFEADIADIDPHTQLDLIPGALAAISRLAGDALVAWAAQEAAAARPVEDPTAADHIAKLNAELNRLSAEVVHYKALAEAEATSRREAETTIAGLLNGGRATS